MGFSGEVEIKNFSNSEQGSDRLYSQIIVSFPPLLLRLSNYLVHNFLMSYLCHIIK